MNDVDENGIDIVKFHQAEGAKIERAKIAAWLRKSAHWYDGGGSTEESLKWMVQKIADYIEARVYEEADFAPAGTGQSCGAANDCHLPKGHTGAHRSRSGRTW